MGLAKLLFSQPHIVSINTYRDILEKYRGLSTRYTYPQCGRNRYIDTENNI